jgi:hypothetical protein
MRTKTDLKKFIFSKYFVWIGKAHDGEKNDLFIAVLNQLKNLSNIFHDFYF